MEVTAPPPAGKGCHYHPCPQAPVKGILVTSSPHFSLSSFLSCSLESSPGHIPPATQLFALDPGAPGGGACLAIPTNCPLHSPPCHPSPFPIPASSWLRCWRRAAQIQRTNQPQHKPEQGFQQAIGSMRARSQLLGKAGAAKLRLSSCSISCLEWSHPLCHNYSSSQSTLTDIPIKIYRA